MTTPVQLNPGTVFSGEYRIVRPLSAGGMGAVYIAEQASTGKLRALKLMHPMLLADPRLRERFEQEARVGALIRSNHVVQVIGAGVDQPTGVPWLAMELLEGEDLAACIRRRGSLQPGEVYEIFRQVGHALGAAHAVGVVHRDLKPENIFLARSHDATGLTSVKILDFGIAKVVAESKTTATAALGTPLWMAPEQTDPRVPITPATDVWPLGLIAFTMLTGRVYWKIASDPLGGMTALMREILIDPMAPASYRAAELSAAGAILPGFDAWFARCTVRDPRGRFSTAAEALEALGPALSAAATGARSYASVPPTAQPASTTGALSYAPMPPAAQPPPRKTPMAGIIAGMLGIFGVTAALTIFFSRDRDLAQETLNTRPNAGIQGPQEVQGAATAAQVVSPAAPGALAATTAVPSTGAKPVGVTKPSSAPKQAPATAPTAASGGRPFDTAAASRAIQQSASTARNLCSNLQGPRVVSVTLWFNNAGAAQRTDYANLSDATTASGGCVWRSFSSTRVPPFDGPNLQQMPATAALN